MPDGRHKYEWMNEWMNDQKQACGLSKVLETTTAIVSFLHHFLDLLTSCCWLLRVHYHYLCTLSSIICAYVMSHSRRAGRQFGYDKQGATPVGKMMSTAVMWGWRLIRRGCGRGCPCCDYRCERVFVVVVVVVRKDISRYVRTGTNADVTRRVIHRWDSTNLVQIFLNSPFPSPQSR